MKYLLNLSFKNCQIHKYICLSTFIRSKLCTDGLSESIKSQFHATIARIYFVPGNGKGPRRARNGGAPHLLGLLQPLHADAPQRRRDQARPVRREPGRPAGAGAGTGAQPGELVLGETAGSEPEPAQGTGLLVLGLLRVLAEPTKRRANCVHHSIMIFHICFFKKVIAVLIKSVWASCYIV